MDGGRTMNLYLISRPDEADWDEYDSAVVVADSQHAAKQIHPGFGGDMTWVDSRQV